MSYNKLEQLRTDFQDYIETLRMDAPYRKMLATLYISLHKSNPKIPKEIIKNLADKTQNASRCDMVNAQMGHPSKREVMCNKFKDKGYNCIWDEEDEKCKFNAGPEHNDEKVDKSAECNIM